MQTRESQKLLPPGVWVQVPHPPPLYFGQTPLKGRRIFSYTYERCVKNMALQKYTREWLSELCAESYSYAEVLRKAGRA